MISYLNVVPTFCVVVKCYWGFCLCSLHILPIRNIVIWPKNKVCRLRYKQIITYFNSILANFLTVLKLFELSIPTPVRRRFVGAPCCHLSRRHGRANHWFQSYSPDVSSVGRRDDASGVLPHTGASEVPSKFGSV